MNNKNGHQTPSKEEMEKMIAGTRQALKDLKDNKHLLTKAEKEELSEIAEQLENLKAKKSEIS